MTPGPIAYAQSFAGAALFGMSAPLLAGLDAGSPRLTAALLYGSFGLVFLVLFRPWREPVAPTERPWLALSLGSGGGVAPLLLVLGLRTVSGAEGALWLGAEPVLTVTLGVLLFREPSSRRLWISLTLMAAAGAFLVGGGAWRPGVLYLLAAAACWGLDNQAAAHVVSIRPQSLTAWKGLAGLAGNLLAAGVMGDEFHFEASTWITVASVGLLSYGASLLFVLRAMRTLGAGRTITAFAASPLVGALAGAVLGQAAAPLWSLAASALLVSAASWLLLAERHHHAHAHEEIEHTHEHVHDEHHQHAHVPGESAREPHTHPHRHAPLTHVHPHVADVHHRHH